jgi:hypothetical protein
MPLSRREFLKLGGLAAATLTASACGAAGRQLAQNELPESLQLPPLPADGRLTASGMGRPAIRVNPALRLLNRAGYGPRPGDLARLDEMGYEAYLEEQLNPEGIEDTAADLMLRNLTYYPMEIGLLVDQEEQDVGVELGQATISRAIFSRRQLYEAMVEFWSDHFNIYIRKNALMVALKVVDDREVIRPHALGNFRDLLMASVSSPAMLSYLDNVHNEKGRPNENYARELMELHTLGVHGGYSQADVQEAARVLTGWGMRRRGPDQGQFFLNAAAHDEGEKELLGQVFPAGQGGQQDVAQLVDLLANHPSTAQHLATKLVRRFVADEPPAALVERVAQTFTASGGDIQSVLRVLFLSEEFATAPPKLKRPYTFLVSALRAVNGQATYGQTLANWLQMLGQPLFQWPPPNGYPDVSGAWVANLLPRWNFAIRLLTGRIRGVSAPLDEVLAAGQATDVASALDVLAGVILSRPLDEAGQALFSGYVGDGRIDQAGVRIRLPEAAALMIASPAFQWT